MALPTNWYRTACPTSSGSGLTHCLITFRKLYLSLFVCYVFEDGKYATARDAILDHGGARGGPKRDRQPVARITTSTATKKRQSSRRMMSLPATFVQRISHGCRERAERGAVVFRIAQSVDHRQYDRAVHFQYPYLNLYRGYTNSTNLAATVSLP